MATATACANIALVKYWGKRDVPLNLPAAGSLSLTLDRLRTYTKVEFIDEAQDRLTLDGNDVVGKAVTRVSELVDLVRREVKSDFRVRVESKNNFPTAAGLASSASAFAALAVAASEAFGLKLDPRALSILARRGSGSAARSIFGGYVRMHGGHRSDGRDAYAEPLSYGPELHAVIAVAKAGEKDVGSTDGMEHTRHTSPYHEAWVDLVSKDLRAAQEALRSEDMDKLALITEGSCLAMHANAQSARPGIMYFEAPTLWAMKRVRALRAAGTPVFFTVDAGPHLVAFTPPEHADKVAEELGQHPDVQEILRSAPGDDAQVIEAMPA